MKKKEKKEARSGREPRHARGQAGEERCGERRSRAGGGGAGPAVLPRARGHAAPEPLTRRLCWAGLEPVLAGTASASRAHFCLVPCCSAGRARGSPGPLPSAAPKRGDTSACASGTCPPPFPAEAQGGGGRAGRLLRGAATPRVRASCGGVGRPPQPSAAAPAWAPSEVGEPGLGWGPGRRRVSPVRRGQGGLRARPRGQETG